RSGSQRSRNSSRGGRRARQTSVSSMDTKCIALSSPRLSMPPKLCSINVDLDEIPNYWAIHGLSADAAKGSPTAVYDVAVPRLCDFAAASKLPLTLFAIGDDLSRSESARALRTAVSRGNGVGNHTQSHLYDLTRRDVAEIAKEVELGA